MSRQTIREAAALMRQRAAEAYHPDAKYEPGRWMTEHHNSQYGNQPDLCHIAEDRKGVYWSVAHKVYIPIAEHMAGLDPFTAFNIADWLDQAARRWWWFRDRHALAVANAYLELNQPQPAASDAAVTAGMEE
jgi:hypothetical protein